MAVTGPVIEVMRAGGSHIPDLLDRVETLLSDVAASHGVLLAEHAGATIAAGGKRLRPLLVFLAADAEEGDGLVRAAAAVELVHSATLVHDDVLDAASLRRGVPTVVAVGGRGAATATGDLLFARAFAELSANGRADEIQVLSEASSALAEGELLQRADAWNAEVALERYLRRCELKTARLFEAACRLGALEGGGSPDELGAFGRRIGLAFQLLDDVLDVSGPAERTGKQRGTDLLDGTITLPFILARERDGELAALDRLGGRGRGRLRSHRRDRSTRRGPRPRVGDGQRGQGGAAGRAVGAPAPRPRARRHGRRRPLRLRPAGGWLG